MLSLISLVITAPFPGIPVSKPLIGMGDAILAAAGLVCTSLQGGLLIAYAGFLQSRLNKVFRDTKAPQYESPRTGLQEKVETLSR